MSSTNNMSSTTRMSYLRPALVLLILLTLITG
ncbi:potassium-transporting ATPase subunit C, partial [Yersinia enterocolitica]